MDDALGHCIDTLNAVFARACLKLQAIQTNHLGNPAIRVIQQNMPAAAPFAGLSVRDRRNLASAFKAAGFDVGESDKLLGKSNAPAVLFEYFEPPMDAHNLVNYHAPWEAYLLKPDVSFLRARADALAEKLVERYASYVPAY
jgi:hypothetical protein